MQRRRPLERCTATLAVLIVLVADPAGAIVPPYTDHEARQNAHLVTCREKLDLAFDASSANEFGVYVQSLAVLCELTAQERGLGDNVTWGPVTHGSLDALVGAMSTRVGVMRGLAGTYEDPIDLPCCYTNVVILRSGTFFLSYILYRFPVVSWSQPTQDALHQTVKEGNWYPWGGNVGNSILPLTGMRLLMGELSGDTELYEYGRMQLYQGRDESVRHGLAEPMAPHYAGITLSYLGMLTVLADVELRSIVEDLLAYSLLIPAHLYLPGGGLGSPQDREKSGGGIADPDPTEEPHLMPALNILVGDPDLLGAADPSYLLASSYQAPEIIRSIFLDKGSGYEFRYRGNTAQNGETQTGWYAGRRNYPSQGQGISLGREVDPWHAVGLPDGSAQMGFYYGSGSASGQSSGLYVRADQPGDFAILYHHQSRELDPLNLYPRWNKERKSNSRRMLVGRTSVTLFDTTATELPTVDPSLEYTMVHLPDFNDTAVGDGMIEVASTTLQDASWFVGQSGNTYVAFLPLGNLTQQTNMPPTTGPKTWYSVGNWIYLQLDGIVSGNITELATTTEYATLQDYANDLAARHVAFSGTSGSNAVAEVDVDDGGTTKRIRLEYGSDARFIDGVQQLDQDFLALEGLIDSPYVAWDESSFTMTVSRSGYAPLLLDLGDPAIPTTPTDLWIGGPQPVNNPVPLRWLPAQDDVGVIDYDVYRDGQLIGTQTGPSNEYTGSSPSRYTETHPTDASGLTRVAKYQVSARDAQGNVSPTLSMVYDVVIPETDLDGDGVGNFSDDDDDGDGLLDVHETRTGVYVSPTDTGTDPLLADSDGDGYDDGAEVSAGSDPNDPLSLPPPSVPAMDVAQGSVAGLLLLALGLHVIRRKRSEELRTGPPGGWPFNGTGRAPKNAA